MFPSHDPDPTYYSPVQESLVIDGSVILTEIEFPITFPIDFSDALTNDSDTINYVGTWLTYPTIIITGPISGCRITNDAIGEFIQLNREIGATEVITISLDYGNKSVEDQAGNNLIGTVSQSRSACVVVPTSAPEI